MDHINIVFENGEYIQLSDHHLMHAHIKDTHTDYYLNANGWYEITIADDISLTIKVPTGITLNDLVNLADDAKHNDSVSGDHIYGYFDEVDHIRVDTNPKALERLIRFRDIAQIERVTGTGDTLTHHFVPYDDGPQGENRYQQTNLQQIKGSEYIQITIRKT